MRCLICCASISIRAFSHGASERPPTLACEIDGAIARRPAAARLAVAAGSELRAHGRADRDPQRGRSDGASSSTAPRASPSAKPCRSCSTSSGRSRPVYVGGPVQPSSVVFLAEFLEPALAGVMVLGRIGFPAPDAGVEELAETTERRRVFAGHAGWGRGQLDAEIAEGAWIAHPAEPARRVHRYPGGAVEHRAHAHGRQLRAARPHAAGPERQLSLRLRLRVVPARARQGAGL